jgi:sulfofructose kinase
MKETFGATLVCATLGEAGSLAVTDDGDIRTPGFAVSVVDTTGAGDVFRGGFISGWLRGGAEAQTEDVLRYANAAAALKCRALGARAGIPTHAEVARLLM